MLTKTRRAKSKDGDCANLYESVADRVAQLIDAGTLRPGQRIPSVRKTSTQLQVSISTVLQAYRLLEDRGRIAARPQSGYYVRERQWSPPPEPEMTRPPATPAKVTMGDVVMRFMQDGKRKDVVPLGVAISSLSILPHRQLHRLSAAIARRSPDLAAGYEMPPGCESLRVQIARRAIEGGDALAPDDVVVTCGGQEALTLCLRAVAKPGDAVAIESPAYYGVLQTLEVLGLRAVEIPTHPRRGVCLDATAHAVRKGGVKACLFVPTFHNPLGYCMDDDRRRRLLRILAERDVPLIEDDIYGDLGFAPQRPRTCRSFDTNDLVLLCGSFSKTLAPGYRVGWCAPGPRYRDQVMKLKAYTTLATATLPQLAIAEYLATGGYEHYLRRVRRVYADQVERMTRLIVEHFPAGTKVTRPAGGFVVWVELPAKVDAMALHQLAMHHGISVAPGPMFSPKQKFRNFIRLNCAVEWSPRVDAAVATVARLMPQASR